MNIFANGRRSLLAFLHALVPPFLRAKPEAIVDPTKGDSSAVGLARPPSESGQIMTVETPRSGEGVTMQPDQIITAVQTALTSVQNALTAAQGVVTTNNSQIATLQAQNTAQQATITEATNAQTALQNLLASLQGTSETSTTTAPATTG